jgi:hypothetical protein
MSYSLKEQQDDQSEVAPLEDSTSRNIPPPRPPIPPKRVHLPSQICPPPSLPPNAFPTINHSDFMRFIESGGSISDKPENRDAQFKPCYLFFYGSLMDPEVLQAILELPELPKMKHASISGYSMKMWGIYPALTQDLKGDGKVYGTVWKVISEAHFHRLAAYETSAYAWRECDVETEDGEILNYCRFFCWAGDPDSKDLEDGSFSLEHYQKYFKPSITRRCQ